MSIQYFRTWFTKYDWKSHRYQSIYQFIYKKINETKHFLNVYTLMWGFYLLCFLLVV